MSDFLEIGAVHGDYRPYEAHRRVRPHGWPAQDAEEYVGPEESGDVRDLAVDVPVLPMHHEDDEAEPNEYGLPPHQLVSYLVLPAA